MTLTKLTAAVVVHLDALHNLATWLARDSAEAYALVRATCQQAIGMIPQPHAGTNPRVGLLTIMWGLYRTGHPLSPDGANEIAVEPVAADKRMLLHTLSRADLDAGLRQLPEALRAALILSDMEGYPLEDVAVIFGWSKPTTQVALSKARQLLDSILQVRLATTTVSPESEAKNSP
ncbi:MAG: RNA polymerase sigma factor [Planctomycetaceae bacterium]|nr:MAG: RNA polymerase sigma factor [Planctomycetaceae bacterium]